MFDTTKSDAADKRNYTRLKNERNARDRASIDAFAAARPGGAVKPAAVAPAAKVAKPAQAGGRGQAMTIDRMMGKPQPKSKPKVEQFDDE